MVSDSVKATISWHKSDVSGNQTILLSQAPTVRDT